MTDKKRPCESYPNGRECKTVATLCPLCGSWECWRRYLSWEKSHGITLNQDLHPAVVDDDHKRA